MTSRKRPAASVHAGECRSDSFYQKPLEAVIAALERAGYEPREAAGGWECRCPAHDDTRPSLSVAEGEGGRCLVHCHAGCEPAAIVDAIGLQMRDLMPPRGADTHESPRAGAGRRKPRSYPTREAALRVLSRVVARDIYESHPGARIATTGYEYHHADGSVAGAVARWDWSTPGGESGKEIRQLSRLPDGRWTCKAMPEPRPLYGLPALLERPGEVVLIAEGEKCCDSLMSLSLLATTSPGGSKAPRKTDWSPLAGRDVVILPDEDAAGKRYAETVANILASLQQPAKVRLLRLPGLEPGSGDDIVDWLEQGGTKEELLKSLQTDAVEWERPSKTEASASDSQGAEPWPEIVPFESANLPEFPTRALPDVLRRWVEAESHATQTPADLPAMLALAVCSACLARRVVVEPRPGWREPVNLFVAILLEPGNRKSAVFADAIKPLRELEAELIEAARPEVARAQSDRRQSEARLRKLEKLAAEKGDADARHEACELAAELAEQSEPVLPRLIVDDATAEKLGIMLAEQGGRIASMSPEGGVFDLMAGLYSKSGIPQFGVYLMGHSGDDLITDRVGRKSVRVERPALTCGYAMQPAVIEGLAENTAFRGRGLLARFVYSAPQSWIGRREIAPAPVSDATREAYRQVVRALAEVEGEIVLQLSADAAALLRGWEAEIEAMLGDGGQMEIMRDWGAKLAGATLRLAAVLHSVERGPTGHIDGATIAAAVTIARYLIPHAEVVMNMMSACQETADDDARYVLRWIERHGRRRFTKTEAQHHGKRRFRRADDIDPALAELVRRGYIRPRPTGASGPGRPPSPAYDVNPTVFELTEKRSQYSQNSPRHDMKPPIRGILGNIRSASGRTEEKNLPPWMTDALVIDPSDAATEGDE